MSDTTPTATLLDDSMTFTRTIDAEAMKRLNAEIEAKARAEAEQKTAEAEKGATMKRTKPEPAPRALSIREFLNSASVKSSNARILELCQKYGIDIDKNPWPPQFTKESEPELLPQPPAKVVQLDFWEDNRRAAPNITFRSALFPALKFKKGRLFLKQKQLFATKGGEVYFTGEQFDQSDLDVYLEILNFAKPFPLGTPVKFSAYSMLNALGRSTGKSDHAWLHLVLIRLCGGVVDMTDHKKRYCGGLIHTFIKDEITKEYEIIIDPKFAVLFGFGMWSALDKAQRCALGRNQTAKALHAYYSTHAAPAAHRYETLAEIVGLQNKQSRDVRANLIKAHEELKKIGFLSDYEAGPETIKVKINQTPSQSRYLVRKVTKARRQRQPKGTG